MFYFACFLTQINFRADEEEVLCMEYRAACSEQYAAVLSEVSSSPAVMCKAALACSLPGQIELGFVLASLDLPPFLIS